MKYSYHVHSTYSDGKSSIREIIQKAKELNLDQIGISDHLHIPNDGLLIPGDMQLNRFDDYVQEILSYSFTNKPRVKLGLEVEFIPETLDQVEKLISQYPFDYIIGSDHKLIIYACENKLSQKAINTMLKQYWFEIEQIARCPLFDIIGHLDLPKSFKLTPTINLSKEIDSALNSIKKHDKVVELNTSGWFKPNKEQYPSVDILEKCIELDIPIIVSADAHDKDHLIRGFDEAYKLLKEIGYNKIVYFDKRKKYFNYVK